MKKKKKLTGQQIKFIINMVSLAIFAFSYLYIYSYYVNKTDAAYQEKSMVEKYIKTMEDKIAQKDKVLQDTTDVNGQVQAILDKYPVDIRKVDNYLFVEQMQKDLGITFSNVSPSDSSQFIDTLVPMRNADGTEVVQMNAGKTDSKAAQPTKEAADQSSNVTGSKSQSDALSEAEAAAGDTASSNNTSGQAGNAAAAPTTMNGLRSTITMNFQTSYDGFKKLVDYINNYPSKTVIDSVTISVDGTTGQLTGTLVIVRYALSGTGKTYELPTVNDISIGTDDIFGTVPGSETDTTAADGQDNTQQDPAQSQDTSGDTAQDVPQN